MLQYAHTAAARSELAERFAPATADRRLAALRGVSQEAWRLGLMSAEDYQRAADLKYMSGSTLPAGREISPGELRALFATCAGDEGVAGIRDAALLSALYTGLLRRAEAAALDLARYSDEEGQLTVRRGQGRKDRLTYVGDPGSREASGVWLEVRGLEEGPLFCPISKRGSSRCGE